MTAQPMTTGRLGLDFWKFWTGQVVSNFGSSFTQFAAPLIIYKLTHSAVNLAITMAAVMLPYLLFGLVIGAWVDRIDRKRLMIGVNLLLAAVVGSIPLAAALGHLTVLWLYAVFFVSSTLNIFFNAAEFAAIPSLVGADDLVTANGRIQASYFAASVAGPVLAGILVTFVPIPSLMLVDAASYVVSAAALSVVRTSFNVESERKPSSVRQDVVEGLKYVLSHPVLRSISAMMALVNFVSTTTGTQIVLYAKERLHTTNSELGLLFSVSGVGVVIFSLAAGPLRKRLSFSVVALGCLMVSGVMTIAFALTPWFWPALALWGLESGFSSLFNIQTSSLRQQIVPNHLLGRVMSIAGVLAWSAIPLGALLGGAVIQRTHNVEGVYAGIGVLLVLIPGLFWFSPLGHPDRYLAQPERETDQAAIA